MFYENFLACATKEEIEEVVNDYLKAYPKFDKDQPTIEEFITQKECQKLDNEY